MAQVIMGLASGLSRLDDGGEEFIFIANENASNWLGDHIAGPCQLHLVTDTTLNTAGSARLQRLKRRIAKSPIAPFARRVLSLYRGEPAGAPRSDGVAEALGANLVHFPTQAAYLTYLPSIYHPYDLQHIHFPHFFSDEERRQRDIVFPLFSSRATFVPVESSWAKDDFVRYLKLPPNKVVVVAIPPPTLTYREPSQHESDEMARQVGFTEFAYYPAQTWPHKNHIRLLEALAILRDEHDLIVPLVCSGHKNSFFSEISARVATLGLQSQVRFLGYLAKHQICALYDLCKVVIVATKFDPASLPIWEAFEAGKPVACSDILPLAQQTAGAALMFNHDNPRDIAAAISLVWTDSRLREQLSRKGRQRVAQFSWPQTARHFRALYRAVLGRGLTVEDGAILQAAPLI